MIYREAKPEDITSIMRVRLSVKENTLSNPDLVTAQDCLEYITQRGKGWVCEIDHQIVGFAIVDLIEHNIWALFLSPDFEKRGIGKTLHDSMLTWYFKQTKAPVWLGTTPKTRADGFYRKVGWKEIGTHGAKEIKFEMTYENWLQSQKKKLSN